ncbi:long-chain fatty acid--CoA ligase [Defluviimonas sp. 20V17]|uniref:Fatty-acyl-CoA synthase n=1 Tax=Allgaiera indica TaxID=765699 RepID=A0AAN4US48_9RHOB|nr:long-chain-fatty-acid--CoA ligase [Allgaiera indica]KDB01759.1 long-chain fatty acid--CoA ligase [Defluviimonas sp. 20V17]GHE02535.1 long-chain-fatty-acid--CoA ligase [Allgaiera indica]SDX28314.1 fatty-acyl-CoA synthase [Allgaiera indica]
MRNTRHYRHWPAGVPYQVELPAQSVAQNLEDTAARVPETPAIHYYGRTLRYGELAGQARAVAGWLKGQGVARGDRVLLYMQNSPQYVAAFYGILRADAVVVPVNPMNRTAELAHLVADTGARVAIAGQELLDFLRPALGAGLQSCLVAAYADAADPGFAHPLPPPLDQPGRADYGPRIAPWSQALSEARDPGPITAGPDDLAVIPYSSGSTGHPKGCMHSHRTVMATAVGSVAWSPGGDEKPALVSLPLFHVTGMQNSMNGPILAGQTMVIMTRWDRRLAAYLIERYRVGRWRSITTMAIDLVNDPEVARHDLSSLEAIGGGGAAMPAAVAARLKALTGLDYVEGYGMSEAMAATHINPPQAPRPQCLGIPVFDVDSRVIDPDTGQELPAGTVGEIVIDGPQVFLGYWNNPEATEAAFILIDGKRFLRSGDIGYMDADGYFYITDRLKRMINASGYKVWPTEVEQMIHDHPQVADVCITAKPDPRRGESVLAWVVARPGPGAADGLGEEALIAWCRARMAAYKVPAEVRFLEVLPRSPSGKTEWRSLQEKAFAG